MAAICHKSWGSRSRPEATSLPPPTDTHFPSFVDSPPRGLGRARSLAAKYFDTIYAVKQRYEVHIGLFNVLPGSEISVYVEFSHCRQN